MCSVRGMEGRGQFKEIKDVSGNSSHWDWLLCLDSPGPGETGVGVGVGVGGVGPLAYPPCQYFPLLFSLCSPPSVVSLVVWCRTARSGDSRGGSLSQVETVSQGGLDQPLQPHQHSDGH